MHTLPQFVTTHNPQFTSLFTIHCTQHHSLSRLTINSSHHSLLSIAHSTTVCHDSQSTVHITLYYPLHTAPQFVTTHNQQFTSLFTIHCTQNHSLSRFTINSSHHSLLSISHTTTVCHDSQSTVHITLYYPLHTEPLFVTTHNQQFTPLFTVHFTHNHSLSRLTINSSHHSLLSIAHSLSRLTINSSHHSLLSISHRTTVCHDSQSTVHITLYYPLHSTTVCHDSQSTVHITLYYPLHTACHDSQSTVQFTSLFTIHCTHFVMTHNQQFTSLFTIHFTQFVTTHNQQSTSLFTIHCTVPQFVTTHNQQFNSHHSLLSIAHSLSRLTINSSVHITLYYQLHTVCHDSQSTVHITLYYPFHTVCHDSQSTVHITLYYPLHSTTVCHDSQSTVQFTSLFTIHCTQLVTTHNQQFTSLFTIHCTQYHSGFCGYVKGSHHSFGENNNNKIHSTASTHKICHYTPSSLWSLLQETTENCPRLPRNC